MSIGEYLKQARKEAGCTQADIAQLLGLSRPSIGNTECDRQCLQLDDFMLLVSYLNISISDLFKEVYGMDVIPSTKAQAKIKRLEMKKSKIEKEIKQLKKNDL